LVWWPSGFHRLLAALRGGALPSAATIADISGRMK
jgi:hypothetical protein